MELESKKNLPIEYLKECFIYCPETGALTWRLRPLHHFNCSHGQATFNGSFAGKKAGVIKSGYVVVGVSSLNIRAHRIAWAIHHGRHPAGFIDHINGNKSDNRIENLREASKVTNGTNCKRRRDNTSGVVGVSYVSDRGNWNAYINTHEKKRISLGRYENLEDAIEARKNAEKQYGYHENHGR